MDQKSFICRFCLANERRSVNLFEQFILSEKVYLYQWMCRVFYLNIKKNDCLTEEICLSCLLKVYQTLFFSKKCQESEKTLFQKLGIRPKSSSTQGDSKNEGNGNHVPCDNGGHAPERLEIVSEKEEGPQKPYAETGLLMTSSKDCLEMHHKRKIILECKKNENFLLRNSEVLHHKDSSNGSKNNHSLTIDLVKKSNETVGKIPATIRNMDIETTMESCMAGSYDMNACKEVQIVRKGFELSPDIYESISFSENTCESPKEIMVIDPKNNMDTKSDYHLEFIRFLNSNISDKHCFEELANEVLEANLQEKSILNDSNIEIAEVLNLYQNNKKQVEVKKINQENGNHEDGQLKSTKEHSRCIRSTVKNISEICVEDKFTELLNGLDKSEEEATQKDVKNLHYSCNDLVSGNITSSYDSDAETENSFPMEHFGKETSPIGKIYECSFLQSNEVDDCPAVSLMNSRKSLFVQQKECISYPVMEANGTDHVRNMEDKPSSNCQIISQTKTNICVPKLKTENGIQVERLSRVDVTKRHTNENKFYAEKAKKSMTDAEQKVSSVEVNDGKKEKEVRHIKIVNEKSRCLQSNTPKNFTRKRKYSESSEIKHVKIKFPELLGEICVRVTSPDKVSKHSFNCLSCPNSFASSDELLQHVLQHIKGQSLSNLQCGSTPTSSQPHFLKEKALAEEEVEVLWESISLNNVKTCGFEDSLLNTKTGDEVTERHCSSKDTNVVDSQKNTSKEILLAKTSAEIENEECSMMYIGKTYTGVGKECKKVIEYETRKSTERHNNSCKYIKDEIQLEDMNSQPSLNYRTIISKEKGNEKKSEMKDKEINDLQDNSNEQDCVCLERSSAINYGNETKSLDKTRIEQNKVFVDCKSVEEISAHENIFEEVMIVEKKTNFAYNFNKNSKAPSVKRHSHSHEEIRNTSDEDSSQFIMIDNIKCKNGVLEKSCDSFSIKRVQTNSTTTKDNNLENVKNAITAENVLSLISEGSSSSLCTESKFSLGMREQNLSFQHAEDKMELEIVEEVNAPRNKTSVNILDVIEEKPCLIGKIGSELMNVKLPDDKIRHSVEDCSQNQSHVPLICAAEEDYFSQSSNIDIPLQDSQLREIIPNISNDETSINGGLISISKNNMRMVKDCVPIKNNENLLDADTHKETDYPSQVDVVEEPLTLNELIDSYSQKEINSTSCSSLEHAVKPYLNLKQGNITSTSEPSKQPQTYEFKDRSCSLMSSSNIKGNHYSSYEYHERGKEDNFSANRSDIMKVDRINNLNIVVASKIASIGYEVDNFGSSEHPVSVHLNELSGKKYQNESPSSIQNKAFGSTELHIPNSKEDGNVRKVRCSNKKSTEKNTNEMPTVATNKNRNKKRKRRRKKIGTPLLATSNRKLAYSFPCLLCSESFPTHGILLKHLLHHKKQSTNEQQPCIYQKETDSSLYVEQQKNDAKMTERELNESSPKGNGIGSDLYDNSQIGFVPSQPSFRKDRCKKYVNYEENKAKVIGSSPTKVKDGDHSHELTKNSCLEIRSFYHMEEKNLEQNQKAHKTNIMTSFSNISNANKLMIENHQMCCSDPPKAPKVPFEGCSKRIINIESSVRKITNSNLRSDTSSSECSCGNLCTFINNYYVDSSIRDKHCKKHPSSDFENPLPKENLGLHERNASGKLAHSSGIGQVASKPLYECWICSKAFPSIQILQQHSQSHFQGLQKQSSSTASNRTSTNVTMELNSQPSLSLNGDWTKIPKTAMRLESQLSKLPICQPTCDASNKLEMPQNLQGILSLNEKLQNDNKIDEFRRMIQKKLAMNEYGMLPGENRCFRCPACLKVYSKWSLMTSHIVNNHHDLSKEWPMSLLFYPKIYEKLSEISGGNLGPGGRYQEPIMSDIDRPCQDLFPCEFCKKNFVSKTALLKHKIWAHIASAENGI